MNAASMITKVIMKMKLQVNANFVILVVKNAKVDPLKSNVLHVVI